ncbi:MAG: DUF305 domain-containing protein [Pseudomonas sp.]
MPIFNSVSLGKKLFCGLGFVLFTYMAGAMAEDVNDQRAALNAVDAEGAFLSENDTAMQSMMAGMGAKPTGDIDRDFVISMSAHHQGAIDMAVTMLKYGHNEQLKRMAQEIIVEQQQEIAAMRQALGDPLPPSVASPTQIASPKS